MNDVKCTWVIYRDESDRDLLVKASECLAAFKQKIGTAANVIGLSSALAAAARLQLEKQGLEVVPNVPAWARSEIWIGRRDPLPGLPPNTSTDLGEGEILEVSDGSQ